MSPDEQRTIKEAAAALYPMRFDAKDRCIGCGNRAGVGHDQPCWLNNLLMLAWQQCGWDNY